MICKQVASESDRFVGDVEVRPQEFDEEPHHLRIGIRKADCVSVLCSFGPVQHATGYVTCLAGPRKLSSTLLRADAFGSAISRRDRATLPLAVVCEIPCEKHCFLFSSQRDVTDPEAYR